jgi:gas vesicle protein
MTEEVPVKIKKEIYDKLKAMGDKTGKSVRELVNEILHSYLHGMEVQEGKAVIAISKPTIIPVKLKYAKCSVCGSDIPYGELALGTKVTYEDKSVRWIFTCLRCYFNEDAMAQKYIKTKELEATVRGLKKLANKYIEVINKIPQLNTEILRIWEEIRDRLKDFLEYARSYKIEDYTVVRARIMELSDTISDLADKLNQLVAPYTKELEELEEEEKEVMRRVESLRRRGR